MTLLTPEALLSHFENPKPNGAGWIVRCPAHDDRTPSLKISQGDDGRWLLFCHAGCAFEDIVREAGIDPRDCSPDKESISRRSTPRSTRSGPRPVIGGRVVPEAGPGTSPGTTNASNGLTLEEYSEAFKLPAEFLKKAGLETATWNGQRAVAVPYRNTEGKVVATRYRISLEGDRFRWAKGSKPMLYGLPALDKAREAGYVVLVEGESDVHALRFHDVPSLGVPGVGTWQNEWAVHFEGIEKIYAIREPDQAGAKLVDALARSPIADRTRVVTLSVKDPSDLHREDPERFLDTLFVALDQSVPIRDATAAVLVQTEEDGDGRDATIEMSDISDFTPATVAPLELGDAAFHGPAGELVRLIEPHSESDPAMLLTNALVGLGNLIGSRPYVRIEGDRHPPRLFVVHVAETSKGRKGTAWGQVRSLLELLDPAWADERITGGLSTGEGLINEVRDRDGNDPGEPDKRLLVVEGELASVLKHMERQGNILSTTLRNAWDHGKLRTMTRNNPLRATAAHISIIGHITREELVRYLGVTEMANGFGNRFLWIVGRRSKALPFGGEMYRVDISPIVTRLRNAIEAATSIDRVDWSPEARPLWKAVYPDLSHGKPGLVGAMVNRAEAQVVRLALLYAILDGRNLIGRQHLEAGLAVSQYAQDSVRRIFGDRTGDPLADRILELLRPTGSMTRDDLRNATGRNYPAQRLDDAVQNLLGMGFLTVTTHETGGRPATIYALR